MELRGPGEVYGVRQSGLPELKIASFQDLELVEDIREDLRALSAKSEKKLTT
jgi:ATP-dependent DNA helicase RecG